jgi:hypothetical protein
MRPARAHATLENELDSEPIQGSPANRYGADEASGGRTRLVSPLQDATTTRAPRVEDPRARIVAPQLMQVT